VVEGGLVPGGVIKRKIKEGRLPHGVTHSTIDKIPGFDDAVLSKPPKGKYKIVNIYWDGDLQKVVVEKLTEPEP